jgi:disulfide oxidoreductase YuzD
VVAFEALAGEIRKEYADKVEMRLTLIDDGVPSYIEEIIEEHYPPLPIILVNGEYIPMGKISLPLIEKEIERITSAG